MHSLAANKDVLLTEQLGRAGACDGGLRRGIGGGSDHRGCRKGEGAARLVSPRCSPDSVDAAAVQARPTVAFCRRSRRVCPHASHYFTLPPSNLQLTRHDVDRQALPARQHPISPGSHHPPSPSPTFTNTHPPAANLASPHLTFEGLYGREPQQTNSSSGKGSWLARVSHRASHIPNRPSASQSRDTLPLRGHTGGFSSHEHLPALSHKKSPSFPLSPASPVETEFAPTPIDASFGDRIATPPERPPPDLPPKDRLGLPMQRSRSGTAVKGETLTMDKYAVQAGDASYDSDADADDEFERSHVGVASPTVPDHFDDDGSDHPSESSEEHEMVDGEDTPTTSGWADRDGRSPTGKITQWTEDQVADYIASLSPALKQYGAAFVEGGIVGDALIYLQHEELVELGVKSVGHRLTILKAVYEQKIRNGVKIEEGDYVPLSAESEKADMTATQDDIARVIESIRLRDQRIIAAEVELRAMKQDLDRIAEENKKLREEALPMMRMMKDHSTPLPDPAGGTIPSPRDPPPAKQPEAPAPKETKGSSLSRKFSTKKLFLGGAPKNPSPTHPPQQAHTPVPREVRDDDRGGHLEASAAAMAASSHLTASMTSQTSPSSTHAGQQLSPTSPAYSNAAPSSGGSYHHPTSAVQRSFPRDAASIRGHGYGHGGPDDTPQSHSSQWSAATTAVGDPPSTARAQDRRRRDAPTPSPREGFDDSASTRDGGRDRDNPQVEIFKSFRVSIEDPCRVVLPVALKRYNITDDWRQYALYIVHGDQERCLGLEEKPLLLFKQLDKEGRKPMFMLRRHAAPVEGWSTNHGDSGGGERTGVGSGGGGGGGGTGTQGAGGKQVPGGVL